MKMQGKEDLLLILNEETFPIIEQITMGMPGYFLSIMQRETKN